MYQPLSRTAANRTVSVVPGRSKPLTLETVQVAGSWVAAGWFR